MCRKFLMSGAVLAFILNMQTLDVSKQRMPSPFREQGIYTPENTNIFPPTEPVSAGPETDSGKDANVKIGTPGTGSGI